MTDNSSKGVYSQILTMEQLNKWLITVQNSYAIHDTVKFLWA